MEIYKTFEDFKKSKEAEKIRDDWWKMDEVKVWDEEDCTVCLCGKIMTPDDPGHWIGQNSKGAWVCFVSSPFAVKS